MLKQWKQWKDCFRINVKAYKRREVMEFNGSMTFEEAEVTLVCKKLFCQRLDPKNMHQDISKRFYDGDAEHDMYIGEVVDILR